MNESRCFNKTIDLCFVKPSIGVIILPQINLSQCELIIHVITLSGQLFCEIAVHMKVIYIFSVQLLSKLKEKLW